MHNFEKGLQAEKKAIKILLEKNFKIIGQRIKSIFGEIDILAKRDNAYYIIEVKYRKELTNAITSLNKSQMQRTLKTFYSYMERNNYAYDQIYFLGFIMNKTQYKIINITDLENPH